MISVEHKTTLKSDIYYFVKQANEWTKPHTGIYYWKEKKINVFDETNYNKKCDQNIELQKQKYSKILFFSFIDTILYSHMVDLLN